MSQKCRNLVGNADAEAAHVTVRLIAERRYGQLLKQLARTMPQSANLNGRRGKEPCIDRKHGSAYAQALADTGTTRQQAQRYQALADVPKKVFDKAILAIHTSTRRAHGARFDAQNNQPPAVPPLQPVQSANKFRCTRKIPN